MGDANCTCNFIRVNKQFCSHIVAVLYTVQNKGSRSVEFHQNLASKISSFSKEELVSCISNLLLNRPDITPIVKNLLEPNPQHTNQAPCVMNKI